MYDIAVIGLGLIGSAAFRHLVDMGQRVIGIGPAEPGQHSDRAHIFGSHYDEGRITRVVDPLPFWAMVGRRSLDAYAALEARSGIQFHRGVGCLRVSADPQAADDTLGNAAAYGRAEHADYALVTGDELAHLFPFFHFPEGSQAAWEQGGAGHVSPRKLVSAQLIAAVNSGGSMLRSAVTHIQEQKSHVSLTLDSGEQVQARQVLVTGGAWSNRILPSPLKLTPRAATTVRAVIGEDEAERLTTMPSIIYRLKAHPLLYSIYALPPIRYPDGRWIIKIGGTFFDPTHFDAVDAIDSWFLTSGDVAEGEALQAVLLALLPDLAVQSFHTKPCVVTYTEHGHPYIDRVSDRVAVGVGGCGAAAKSSNEIGRIAAMAAVSPKWHYDVDKATLAAIFD